MLLSGLSRIFRKPFANVHISRKVAFAHVWQIYACGPRSCKTFHGFLHGVQYNPPVNSGGALVPPHFIDINRGGTGPPCKATSIEWRCTGLF